MLQFFIIIFLLLIIFHLSTKQYLNPYKLIMIFGKKGSGKTTTLTKIALQHIKKGWKVYSTIDIPGTYLINVEELGKFVPQEKSVLLIDEVGMIWDNRNFKGFKPEVRDYFKLQRHYKNKVYLFSQVFDIDKKLRDLTDELWLLKSAFRVFSIQRRIIKKIDIKECADGTSTLSDTYKFDSIFGGLKFVFIPRYIQYFNSHETEDMPLLKTQYQELSELQKDCLNTKKWVLYKLKVMFIGIVNYIRGKASRRRNATAASRKKLGGSL